MTFFKNKDIKYHEELSELLLQPQNKECALNPSSRSTHAKLRDTTAISSGKKSKKMVHLISRFEELDSITASIPNVTNPADTIWSNQQLSPKGYSEEALQSSPQSEFSRQNEALPEAEDISEKMIAVKEMHMEEICYENHSTNVADKNLPLSFPKLDCSQLSGNSIKYHQNLLKLPNLQNCTNSKKRAVSLQEKISFFEDRTIAMNSKKKSFPMNQSIPVQEYINKVNEVNPNSESNIGSEQKSNDRVVSNDTIFIPGKNLGHRDSIFRKSSVTNMFKQSLVFISTNHMSATTPLIPEGRKISVESYFLNPEIASGINIKEHDSNPCNGNMFQEKGNLREQNCTTENAIRGLKRFGPRPSEKIEAIYLRGLNQRLDISKTTRGQTSEFWQPPNTELSNKKHNILCNPSFRKILSENRNMLKLTDTWKNSGIKSSFGNKLINIPKKAIKSTSFETLSPGRNCRSCPEPAGGEFSRDMSPKSSHLYRFLRPEHAKSESEYECVFLVPQRFESPEQNLNVLKYVKEAGLLRAVVEDRVRKSRNKISEQNIGLTKEKIPYSKFRPVFEKIKKIEDIEKFQKTGDNPKKRFMTRKVNHSLKEIFECWSSTEKSRKPKNLCTKKIVQSRAEFQDMNSRNNPQQNKMAKKLLTNDFQFVSIERPMRKRMNASPLGKVDFWPIREVNCALKQPRPLRAIELKRMMLLCREKIAGINNMNDGLT